MCPGLLFFLWREGPCQCGCRVRFVMCALLCLHILTLPFVHNSFSCFSLREWISDGHEPCLKLREALLMQDQRKNVAVGDFGPTGVSLLFVTTTLPLLVYFCLYCVKRVNPKGQTLLHGWNTKLHIRIANEDRITLCNEHFATITATLPDMHVPATMCSVAMTLANPAGGSVALMAEW